MKATHIFLGRSWQYDHGNMIARGEQRTSKNEVEERKRKKKIKRRRKKEKMREKKERRTLPAGFKKMLESFHDIFPKDIPQGWLPNRGIEHQTNFTMGATLPSRTACKANLEESKEIKQQLDKLIEKSWVYLSLANVCFPVYLQLSNFTTGFKEMLKRKSPCAFKPYGSNMHCDHYLAIDLI
ncbi:hypothetical protein CR513_00447, partial [Mucuna pruriens]